MPLLSIFHRNWLAFAAIASALAFSIGAVLYEHHEEEGRYARQQFEAHARWLTIFTALELGEGDYSQLESALNEWAGGNKQVLSLKVSAKNGFAIVDYQAEEQPAGERLTGIHRVPYGSENTATIELVMEHETHKHVVRELMWRVGLLYVTLLVLAAFLLQQRLRRQQEATELRQKTAALEAAQLELGELEERQRLLLESVGEGIYGFDLDGCCSFVNPVALKLLGMERPDQLVGKRVHPLIHHTRKDGSCYPADACKALESVRTGKSAFIEDEVFWHADGHSFPVEYHAVPLVRAGRIIGGVVTFSDISARLAAEAQIRTLSHAVEQSPVSIVVTDNRGIIEYVNPTFERVTGYSRAEAIGQNPRLLKSGLTPPKIYEDLWDKITSGQSWAGEFCCKRKDGTLYWERAFISPVKDTTGRISHFLALKEDITLQRKQAETIRYQAEYDALTGIPNRNLTLERLAKAVATARRNGNSVALMFIDLDDFKKVNDTLGHDAGDALLIEAAKRFNQVIREGDTVGRHGGDEFLIVIENGGDASAAARVARDVLTRISAPFMINDLSLTVTASIGIAVFPENGGNPAELLRNADAAMYAAKDAGRNSFSFFTPAMNQAANRRLELERHLGNALDNDELLLEYQPQMDTATGDVIGVEALLRWTSPTLGSVAPDQFIPLAEQTGQIIPIGRWVLDEACRQLKQWHLSGYTRLRVAVNVSPRQFKLSEDEKNIVALTKAALARHQLPAASLELEITEGLLVKQQADTKALLDTLHGLGVRISMDDFGTGYSSLAYLRQFPFDIVKIDRSFINDLETDPEDRDLVAAILAMAQSLGVTVIAEGVETESQLEFLRAKGCHVIQGYYFGRPMPPQLLASFLSEQHLRATPPAQVDDDFQI